MGSSGVVGWNRNPESRWRLNDIGKAVTEGSVVKLGGEEITEADDGASATSPRLNLLASPVRGEPGFIAVPVDDVGK